MYLCKFDTTTPIMIEERKKQQETPQWMAIYTRARAEKKVSQRLSDLGYENYLPLQRKLHKWSDRNKWIESPLFSSYVFVKTVSSQCSQIIDKVEGACYMVKFLDKIAVIPEEEIQSIKQMLQSEEEIFVRNISMMHKGVKVRVISGPFKGMCGYLVNNCKEGNFEVKITAISLSVIATIDKEMLEVIQ